MELMRTISPNAASASLPPRNQDLRGAQYTTVVTPHPATSEDPRHWTNPCEFDPDRFKNAPTTVDNNETKVKQAGLARCPFPKESFVVKDGRDVHIENSAYGAVYATVEGQAFPLCDTAGYAPFGFGYRRCGGEYLTVAFIKELLCKAWHDGITFNKLDLDDPEKLPVGPKTVIDDDIAFRRGV
jgi:cytochrome P450